MRIGMSYCRWATSLKNSDHEVKKDQGQIRANLADRSNIECYNSGKMGHLERKCRSPATCAVCEGEHLRARHDAAMKFAEEEGRKKMKSRNNLSNSKIKIKIKIKIKKKIRSRIRRRMQRSVVITKRIVQRRLA
jgi:hypothetical protein